MRCVLVLVVLQALLLGGCEGTASGVGTADEDSSPMRMWPDANRPDAALSADATVDGAVDAMPPPDAEPPSPDGVPMFVASGFGGRTVMSCDDGRTFHDRRLSDDNGDHSAFTDKGLAYGNGVFVQLMGWGASASFQASRNGVDWTTIELDVRFGSVSFANGAFVAAGQREAFSSSDGFTWTEVGRTSAPDHVREGGGGGSLAVLANTDGPVFSQDRGVTWRQESTCAGVSSFGGVGQQGGVAYGLGRLVMFDSDGRWCTTTDGTDWRTGVSDAERNRGGGKMMFAGGAFRFMNGASALTSTDGENWTRVDFEPAGVELHAVAASDGGTFVAFNRGSNEFYRSTDGVRWESMGVHDAPTRLTRLVFGYGEASETCPGR
ncbi:MAG: hypothetical protein AAGF12_24985 [Myxococcota bacterium]